ncbi:hypothetical protein E1286_18925 [Nonomuraea terrae]|uniref:FtsX extracellular domain-containing protein n=1 Tax=Nonomuraea terrae TaxID=2530383 RepID=A0A4R4YRQ8_9ACTN|nr:permease-like cell division protein FtsX [Nonomuraea terrae]TDD47034.1 hypothetical protein E1286_18925 [Nonomuraea terrae]
MSSPVEDRLREALADAGASLDVSTLRPLRAPERRRFQMDLRLVAAAAVVVVLGGAAVGLGGPGDEDRAVAANPPSPAREASVFLCGASAPKEPPCQGRNITPLQTKAVEAELERLPQIETVRYVPRSVAHAAFRKSFAHNQALLDAVKVTDLPESFRVTVKKGGAQQVRESLTRMPGVLSIVEQAAPSSAADDVSVFLCQRGVILRECGAKYTTDDGGSTRVTEAGKAATEAQKASVRQLIDSMPEVETYVFEDQATAYENFRRQYQDKKELLAKMREADMPESFRLKLRDDAAWADVLRELRRQPGVARVVNQRCLADRSVLSQQFGLSLPESKVCPVGK